jgi:glycosyltransferase involved in cell wall biosynthesis
MVNNASILIMLHCEQNTGYAIETLESVFNESAIKAGYSQNSIYWSYPKVSNGGKNIIECSYNNEQDYCTLNKYIKEHNITQVLAFDLPYPADILPALYAAGIENIVSYWGASISSLNTGLKLAYKKLEWFFRKYKPHYFIFESQAMQLTATQGRGIPKSRTRVITLGVDTEKFFPEYLSCYYAHKILNIATDRKIIFYSGHMEERKGVKVIIQAAVELVDKHQNNHIHFVLCGNKNNEADAYRDMLEGTRAKEHVTFAGYRTDVAELMRSSSIGVIASTGWDSFTLSSVEMMSSGLPLIVSNLQGLAETIEHNINGFHIEPGDFKTLAKYIMALIADDKMASQFSKASRSRAESHFSRALQTDLIADTIRDNKNENHTYFRSSRVLRRIH